VSCAVFWQIRYSNKYADTAVYPGDVTDPLWCDSNPKFGKRCIQARRTDILHRIRFLGFAAMGLFLTIPCVTLAVVAGFRIARMHKAHQHLWVASRQQLHSSDKERNLAKLSVRSKHPPSDAVVSAPVPVHASSVPPVPPTVVFGRLKSPGSGRVPLSDDDKKRLPSHLPTNIKSPTTAFPNELFGDSSGGSALVYTASHERSHCDDRSREALSESEAVSSVQWQRDNDHSSTQQQGEFENHGEDGYGGPRLQQPSARLYSELSEYLCASE
jgi:hypothetical protein